MNRKRWRVLKEGKRGKGPVIFWMSRDQRVEDNWGLLFAQEEALWQRVPLAVIFCLAPDFLGATRRQYHCLFKGLQEVHRQLKHLHIPFGVLQGNPPIEILRLVKRLHPTLLITDFNPLRIKRQWEETVAEGLTIPLYQVDAHNIVPCWLASPKLEYAAYTIRPKINNLYPAFLDAFPKLQPMPPIVGTPTNADNDFSPLNWEKWLRSSAASSSIDQSVKEVSWFTPGAEAAQKHLETFISGDLSSYNENRNDPCKNGQSNLSPYLHFGHLSPQRVAMEVLASDAVPESKDAFLEELIIRRELSDNFCLYQPDYDSPKAFPAWAQKTLHQHASDRREFEYIPDEFERAATHDPLWNAAQRQMVISGKMHGFLRMYWCKKILEWSPSVAGAMKIATYLNDRYELDGRDPNGYAGIAWSIGGVHDRAWGERPVFGKIRYMNFKGCKGKFDVNAFINTWESKPPL